MIVSNLINFIKRIYTENPIAFLATFFSLVASSLLEGVGLSLFLPLLQLVSASETGNQPQGRLLSVVQAIFSFFHLPTTLGFLLVFVVVVVFLQQFAYFLQQRLIYRATFNFEKNLRKKLFQTLLHSKWLFFAEKKIGYVTNALTTEITRAGEAFYYLNLTLSGTVSVVVYFLLAFFLSWQLTIGALFVGLVALFALKGQLDKATLFGSEITSANADLQNQVTEHLSAVKLVKASANETASMSGFFSKISQLAQLLEARAVSQAKLRALFESSIAILISLTIYIAVELFHLSTARLVLFLFIFYRLAPRLSNLQTWQHSLLAQLPALESVEILIKEAYRNKEAKGGKKASFKNRILFDSVYFWYEPEKIVLRNINLDIPKGKTIAVMGRSGGGKSTIADLIIGLIKPSKGQILVDGVPLEEIDLKQWREKIGYVSQDTILFNASVKENISFGLNLSDSEIVSAAKLAFAHDFITALPNGYNTVIGDRGYKLSGGQKQRLALTRALARKPEILILDEATSSLDADSEKKVQQAIDSIAGNLTIVIITHRPSTIKNADKIYVLKNGHLVESGKRPEFVFDRD